jgi:hypothetical protein
MAKKWNDLIKTAQRVGHDVGMMSRGYRESAESEARLQESRLRRKQFRRAKESEDLSFYFEILRDRTGTWSPESKIAAEQHVKRHPRFRKFAESLGAAPMRGKGWGGAMGMMPKGMGITRIYGGPEGLRSYTLEPRRDQTKREQWLREGFSEEEADKAVRIAAKLKPGARESGVLEEIERWGRIRQNAFGPWGSVIDQKSYDTATERIHELQEQALAEQKDLVTEGTTPSETEYKPPTLKEGQLKNKIARMKIDDKMIGSKRASEIVRDYPTLSKYLEQMTLTEQQEVLGSISDGMSEEEILKFISVQ